MKRCISLLLVLATATVAAQRYSPRETASYHALKQSARYYDAWGLHTSIDLHDCAYYTIRSQHELQKFVSKLCSFMGVVPVGAPAITVNQAGYGYTRGINITQHANGHTDITIRVDEFDNNVYIDIFSCVLYDAHTIVARAQEFFDAYDATVDIIFRK